MLRRLSFSAAVLMVLLMAGLLHAYGLLPASSTADAPPYSPTEFAQVLLAVDGHGQVDLAELKKNHAKLSGFIASLARTSPESQPELFPTVESRLAYWLNVSHALVLEELLEVRGARRSALRDYLHATPIGGARYTRFAIEHRVLAASGDARVWLALYDGTRGGGVLDGAPFDGPTLNSQLDDAARRFVRRKGNVVVTGQTVAVPEVFQRHRADFLEALPDGRKHVLQVVWAFLPDECEEGRPGCVIRSELDRACGRAFERCELRYVPPDATLAVKN